MSRRKPRGVLILALGSMALIAAICVYAIALESNWIRVERVEIALPRLPQQFDGYRIVLLSDFHAGGFWPGSLSRVRRAVRRSNAQSPDLVLLGGDFIYHSTRSLPACFERLKSLQAKDGIIAVLGNHDYWEGASAVRAQLLRNRITELDNSRVAIERGGERLWIAGLSDLWTTRPDADRALSGIPSGEATIMLSHNPDVAPKLQDKPIDLLLAAHTHGGQVWIPFVGGPRVPSMYDQKYRAGLVRSGAFPVYVNRGVGMIYPPVRFLCPPELTVLTLRAVPH